MTVIVALLCVDDCVVAALLCVDHCYSGTTVCRWLCCSGTALCRSLCCSGTAVFYRWPAARAVQRWCPSPLRRISWWTPLTPYGQIYKCQCCILLYFMYWLPSCGAVRSWSDSLSTFHVLLRQLFFSSASLPLLHFSPTSSSSFYLCQPVAFSLLVQA